MWVDDRHISTSLTTIALEPEPRGTRLTYTEQGVYLDGRDTARLEQRQSQLLREERIAVRAFQYGIDKRFADVSVQRAHEEGTSCVAIQRTENDSVAVAGVEDGFDVIEGAGRLGSSSHVHDERMVPCESGEPSCQFE